MVTYALDYSIHNTKGRVLANPKIIISTGHWLQSWTFSGDYVKP